MYLVKTPAFVKKLYPELIWIGENIDKRVYLTFDDGPIPQMTPWVLDMLKTYYAKATFFCIGNNVVQYPEIYNRILNEGHRVGNHTFNHVSGWSIEDSFYYDEVALARKVIDSTLFRPPYGRIKKRQIKTLQQDYKIIMWDILSGDFDIKLEANDCLTNVIKNLQSGSIIVMHDSIKAEDRLRGFLENLLIHLTTEGYACVPL